MEFEIQELREKLKENEKTLQQSAEHGKYLMEKTAELRHRLKTENGALSEKIEWLEQERYSLKIRLEASQTCENVLREDMEAMRDHYLKETATVTEDFNKENARLSQRVRDLEAELEDADHERSKLREHLEQLKSENESLLADKRHAATIDKTASKSEAELWNKLQEEVKEGQQREEMLVSSLETKQKMLFEIEESERNLQKHCAELEDQLFDIKGKQADYIDANERYRDEIIDLQMELHTARIQETDPDRRGNSLFSEVEDHRLRLEKHLNSLRIKYDELHKENEHNLSRISSLQLQFAGLAAAAGNKASASHVEHLETKLAQLQSELRMRVNQEARSNPNNSPILVTENQRKIEDQGNITGYLKAMLHQTQTKCEELTKKCNAFEFKYMSENEQGRQVRHDLLKAEQRAETIWAENLQLKVKLDEIQRKYGENKENITLKVIERINIKEINETKDMIPLVKSTCPTTDADTCKEVPIRTTKKIIRFMNEDEISKMENNVCVRTPAMPKSNSSSVKTLKKMQNAPFKVVTVKEETNECNQQ